MIDLMIYFNKLCKHEIWLIQFMTNNKYKIFLNYKKTILILFH